MEFYGNGLVNLGILLIAAGIVLAAIFAVIFAAISRKLRKQLEKEYGSEKLDGGKK